MTPYRKLVEELRARVRSLEEANRENRRIIAVLASRIPAIEAPQDASKAAEPRSEGPARTEAGASIGWFVAGAAIGVVGTLLFGS